MKLKWNDDMNEDQVGSKRMTASIRLAIIIFLVLNISSSLSSAQQPDAGQNIEEPSEDETVQFILQKLADYDLTKKQWGNEGYSELKALRRKVGESIDGWPDQPTGDWLYKEQYRTVFKDGNSHIVRELKDWTNIWNTDWKEDDNLDLRKLSLDAFYVKPDTFTVKFEVEDADSIIIHGYRIMLREGNGGIGWGFFKDEEQAEKVTRAMNHLIKIKKAQCELF